MKTMNQIYGKLKELTKQSRDPNHFMFEDVRTILLNSYRRRKKIWTDLEHHTFLDMLKKYGKNFEKISEEMKTRNPQLVRAHA